MSGKDSTSSTTSTGSEGSTSDSSSEIEGNLDVTDDDRSPTSHDRASELVSLKVADSVIQHHVMYVFQRYSAASLANCSEWSVINIIAVTTALEGLKWENAFAASLSEMLLEICKTINGVRRQL